MGLLRYARKDEPSIKSEIPKKRIDSGVAALYNPKIDYGEKKDISSIEPDKVYPLRYFLHNFYGK